MDLVPSKAISDALFIVGLFLFVFIVIDLAIAAFRYGISATSSNKGMRAGVMSMVEKQINSKDTILYDAGAGWGGLCFALSRKFNNPVVGLEGGLAPWLLALARQKAQNNTHVTFKRTNIHKVQYENGSIIVAYLCMKGIQELYETLSKQDGHFVLISVAFAVNNIKYSTKHEAKDLWRTPIYIYNINGQNQKP
ncbi:MAG: hypothetical protein CMD81_12365 [Gammaproteobacteria bacterium]|nr:hypothetical protein [Gammaproteobacteria bacterium]HBF09666.1 hypothetical protein [Gammaproteobacteria bacterium]|tara:strand:- start:60 stop:641 length:582 start_codon:yes stop_codon:yes gene_type:complete